MKPLSQADIEDALKQLPDWQYGHDAIEAKFKFKDFFEAFSFMITVATEAEKAQHHPDWSNVYNQVIIKLSTHEAGGVTSRDVQLAAVISRLAHS